MRHSQCSDLKALAIRIAAERGAQLRVTPAYQDEATREHLRSAFARGDFTTWNYDDAYARRASDPQAILAGARSVLCVAVPYAVAKPPEIPQTGRVSVYVGSDDYHVRVRELLAKIAEALDESAGRSVTAIACDTAPLAERAFAARAGLGWIGKHTNLISPQLGSFVFLGEIVTTLELAADVPLKKTCGSCTRCITGCPTGALRGDYTIDAARCISDLTQRRGSIPREMRSLIGMWVWGCDICQEVCPPTQAAQSLNAAPGPPQVQLLDLLRMKSGEFQRRYKKSAMGWRGAAVLRRNAAVALGNSLDRSSVLPLVQAFNEESNAVVRSHIAWALGRIGSPAAHEALRTCLRSEREPAVIEEVTYALSL